MLLDKCADVVQAISLSKNESNLLALAGRQGNLNHCCCTGILQSAETSRQSGALQTCRVENGPVFAQKLRTVRGSGIRDGTGSDKCQFAGKIVRPRVSCQDGSRDS